MSDLSVVLGLVFHFACISINLGDNDGISVVPSHLPQYLPTPYFAWAVSFVWGPTF